MDEWGENYPSFSVTGVEVSLHLSACATSQGIWDGPWTVRLPSAIAG